MRIIYAAEGLPLSRTLRVPNSIFLAGPTPRSGDVASWRPEALGLLEKQGFEGALFVPEARGGGWHGNYSEQVHWEWEALARASCTLFWVPRELETMPGFTTNVEFGFMVALRASRIVLGAPNRDMPKMRYLMALARDIQKFQNAFDTGQVGTPPVPHAYSLEACLCISQKMAAS